MNTLLKQQKQKALSSLKLHKERIKKLGKLEVLLNRFSLKFSFWALKSHNYKFKIFEKALNKLYRQHTILNIADGWHKLKVHKMECEWNEKYIQSDKQVYTYESNPESEESYVSEENTMNE